MPDDIFPFEDDGGTAAAGQDEALLIDIDGFEGPLDLLLALSRSQKVDLGRISVLALAEQYLRFVETARNLRIELAADYLVMAAWLAFLKSRLLLPPDEQDAGPSGEELAAHLAFQLQRLEAMRKAAARLMGRDQLGRDFFARGRPEAAQARRVIRYTATLADLLQGYARMRTKEDFEPLHLRRAPVWTMEEALEHLRGVIGTSMDWAELEAFLPPDWRSGDRRRSALASTFAASLELARLGQIELRQPEAFAPILARRRA
jgi:segregation and condensation protein A